MKSKKEKINDEMSKEEEEESKINQYLKVLQESSINVKKNNENPNKKNNSNSNEILIDRNSEFFNKFQKDCPFHSSEKVIAFCFNCDQNICEICLQKDFHKCHEIGKFDDITPPQKKAEKKEERWENNFCFGHCKRGYEKFMKICEEVNERNESSYKEYFDENIMNYQTIENVKNMGMFDEESKIINEILEFKAKLINESNGKDPSEIIYKYKEFLFNTFRDYGKKHPDDNNNNNSCK